MENTKRKSVEELRDALAADSKAMEIVNEFNSVAKVSFTIGALQSPYVAEYEPVDIKGAPGKYNKEKHMSRAQRKKMKSRKKK